MENEIFCERVIFIFHTISIVNDRRRQRFRERAMINVFAK